MKKTIIAIFTAAMTGASIQAQTIWSYNFDGTGNLASGSSTNTYVVPEVGGGTNIFRIGTGGGSFNLTTSSFGTGNSLIGVAPTGTSINKFTTFNWDNPTEIFSMKFDLRLSGGSSGSWYLFTGNGAAFDSGTSAFSGTASFSGLKLAYGASGTITASNRLGGNWAAITGTGLAQNQNFSVEILQNFA